MTPNTETTCTIRRRAADIIATRGWTRIAMAHTETGPVCLLGALVAAIHPAVDLTSAEANGIGYSNNDPMLVATLASMQFADYEEAYKFNDDRDFRARPVAGQQRVINKLLEGCQ